jgi:hypothetical protein
MRPVARSFRCGGEGFQACRRGFLLGNYEQLLRDLDIVCEWTPDIVVLDEAQRIKNWATKTALTVKRLDAGGWKNGDRRGPEP